MEEKSIQKLNAGISVVFIAAALVLFGVALKNRNAAEPAAEPPASTSAPSQESQQYQDLAGMRQLELAKDFASWTPEAKLETEKTRSGMLAVTGKIAKAFLIVKASVDGKPLTKYESVFVKLNDAGGHLFRPQSLPSPDSGVTSLLFDLSAVPVLPSIPYDETRTPDQADLSAVLLDGKSVRLTAFISSLRPALLEELTLSYVCAEDSDCNVVAK
ncbi:MAG: hypothetical protein QY323_00560 [Patescibacteria group bacterium]|nr:MAG: hypothetical protein QY323_00560 [Patescibacteria group bacterium]